MADSSFDIVSKIDRQEADNALNQAHKEVEQRYDFKGTDASIAWSGESIVIKANSEERANAHVAEPTSGRPLVPFRPFSPPTSATA